MATTTARFQNICIIRESEPSSPHQLPPQTTNTYFASESNRVLLNGSKLSTNLSGKYIVGARLYWIPNMGNSDESIMNLRAASMRTSFNVSSATWNNIEKLDADSVAILSDAKEIIFSFSAEDTKKILQYGVQIFSVGSTSVIDTIFAANYNNNVPNWRFNIDYYDAEPETIAYILYPNGDIIQSESEITFFWQASNAAGTAQSKFDLEVSCDGITWENVASEPTARTSYSFKEYSFTSGEYYWRVRAYNQSGDVGPWSPATKFIVISAPSAPIITVNDSSPQFEISWAQQAQQGFEIELDGKRVESKFSRESRYKYSAWEEDGAHIVRVRVQDQYSIWSPWGAAPIEISNSPGTAIMLTASVAPNIPVAQLAWSGGSDRYIVYRDGAVVGRTPAKIFTDQFGSGECSYQVRGISDSNGYYTLSNSIAVDIQVWEPMLYDISHRRWIALSLSEMQSRTISETINHAASYLHFSGTRKPSVEFGEAIDRNISFDCAFLMDDPNWKAFEAAIGGICCLKLQDGTAITGALASYTSKHTEFYRAYQASIIETDFDEVASND